MPSARKLPWSSHRCTAQSAASEPSGISQHHDGPGQPARLHFERLLLEGRKYSCGEEHVGSLDRSKVLAGVQRTVP